MWVVAGYGGGAKVERRESAGCARAERRAGPDGVALCTEARGGRNAPCADMGQWAREARELQLQK